MIPTVQTGISTDGPAAIKNREIRLYDHAESPVYDPEYPCGRECIRLQGVDLDTAEILRRKLVLSPRAEFYSIGEKTLFEVRNSSITLEAVQNGSRAGIVDNTFDFFIMWPLDGSVKKVTVAFTHFPEDTDISVEDRGIIVTLK